MSGSAAALVQIVDAQLHLWGPDTPERQWPAGRAREAQKPYPIGAEALLFQMDLAGVSRAVLVPPSWEGDRNDLALEAARAHPDRFAVMGRLALDAPESRARVAGWREQPGMLGIRLTLHRKRDRELLDNGGADWLFAAAERAGIPLMIFAPGLAAIDGIAARHPGLKLVVDHLGLDPRAKAPAVFEGLPALCALSRHPNVAVKVSGMPAMSAEPYPFCDLHPHIRTVVDAFGPRRAFFGTDLTRMPCTYYECIRLFTEHLPWLSREDLEWVMGRGVCEWLRWPLR